jgi:hypothetical protein
MVTRRTINASEPYYAAIAAVDGLLGRLRTDRAFVGSVAESAWMGHRVEEGAVDVLVALAPEGRSQVPMMASNTGFTVDREEVQAAEELDLVPLRFGPSESEIRIHVLIASNALYGTMIRDAVDAEAGGTPVRVIRAEDLALLLTVADDEVSRIMRDELISLSGDSFELGHLNERLTSIGLARKTINR